MRFMKASIVFIWVVCLFEIQSAHGCMKKFNNEVDISKAIAECMSKSSIRPENTPKYEEYLKDGFDDKCLAKCVLMSMELLAESGNLDRDAMIDMIEDHAPKNIINKLTEAVTKCSESSGVMKIGSKDDCKPHANFQGCYMASAEKLC